MSNNPAWRGLLAVVVMAMAANHGFAQANVAQVLSLKPKCDDVSYTTPTPQEIASCKLDVVDGNRGYLLVDGQGRPLRKFVDTDGDSKVDTWSYFQDGVESYRETFGKNGYSFRWLTTGGMKWGVGSVNPAGRGVIESWRWISAEEAAEEAFKALANGDFDRIKSLFLTTQEMQALGLPPAEMQRLAALQQSAPTRFQQIRGKLPTLARATFSRLENAQPGAYPADVTGGTQDIIKLRGLILFENAAGEKKHDFIQTGDMIAVGNAWRLTDIPAPDVTPTSNPLLEQLLGQLTKIDAVTPAKTEMGAWVAQRIQIVQKIAEAVPEAKEKENWYKQIFDNLASAIVAGDKESVNTLAKWKGHFATNMPGSNLAAYASYRELWATFQIATSNPSISAKEMTKAQETYHENLIKFVSDYPRADDTPDALIQLAMGSEFTGKEDDSKKFYAMIVKDFSATPNGPKAAGALRRLDSVGKAFELTGPTLDGGANYSLTAAKGKVAVVYYWASYSNQAVGDFATLKKLQTTYGKDLEVVAVNLDQAAAQANQFLQTAPLSAIHLHEPNGGMNGSLATQYGIFGLPHLFLIDRNGVVISSKIQVNALEDEIAKLTKK